MEKFEFGKDVLSIISVLAAIIALLFTILSADLFRMFFAPIIIASFIALFIYIVNYLKTGIGSNQKEIEKINERFNIQNQLSDLKAKVDIIFKDYKMKKRGQAIPIDLIIKIIQIGIIVFAAYIILKALNLI